MELGNLAEDKEAEDREDSSDGNRHSGDEDEGGANKRNVARTFRYMRKRPTIIFYKPPEGELLRISLYECSGPNSVTKPRSGH